MGEGCGRQRCRHSETCVSDLQHPLSQLCAKYLCVCCVRGKRYCQQSTCCPRPLCSTVGTPCSNTVEVNNIRVHPHPLHFFVKLVKNIRGKKIRLFMSEDYEFLSRMYGISGAQGRIVRWSYNTLVFGTWAFQDDICICGVTSDRNK